MCNLKLKLQSTEGESFTMIFFEFCDNFDSWKIIELDFLEDFCAPCKKFCEEIL
jgi:hypothetical protein